MGKIMKKKENDIIITENGLMSEGVTGSNLVISYLTEEGRKTILVELGGSQGKGMVEDYKDNREMIEKTPIKESSYCFIAHIHQDHTSLLPCLSNRDFRGRIISTNTNTVLLRPMLKDSINIHLKDCIYMKNNKKKLKIKGNIKELFTLIDLDKTMDMIDNYEIGLIHKLDDCLSFRFTNNSHIIGATQLELFIKKYGSNVTKKIVVTSDLGNSDNYSYTYFTEPTQPINKANILFIESTYGKGDRNFNKRTCVEERKELNKTIVDVTNRGYACMIPCFSLSRLQNFMCYLYENFKDKWDMAVPIVIATNLGNKINQKMYEVLDDDDLYFWDEVMHWKAFKFIKDYKSCEAFVTSKQKKYLVLSSSGMISGGYSNLFAKQMLQNSHNAILFCGYCSPNTYGGKLLDETTKTVEIEGDTLVKNCIIKRFNSFSSHASQKDLINYIKQCDCQRVVLHHGEKESKEELKEKVISELSKMNRTTKVICSYKDMQIIL